MYGRNVFMGYVNKEDKTREALDEEGWLHSGDLGKKDKDGFLLITGRIKGMPASTYLSYSPDIANDIFLAFTSG